MLIGYIRQRQLHWVLGEKLYNVRADGRRGAVAATDEMLRAPLIALWGGARDDEPFIHGVFERVGPWQIATADDLGATGYPVDDESALYLVSAIEPLAAGVESRISPEVVRSSRPSPFGSPFTVTWEQLTGMDMG